MTIFQWFLVFLAIQVIHFLGTWKLYQKAGRKSWEAAIPLYNAIILMKIINRPTWYTFLLFLPVINLLIFPVIWVETLRSFGKNSTLDTFLGIGTLGLYIYYVNYTQDVTYIKERSLKATTKVGDTVSSLVFAVVVATFVHTYFIQPFTIPTPSLEKSLLVGDFLFVSKFHYGARTPMTPIAAPMVHDTLPLLKIKSYTMWPQLPYFRFPALQKIKNNDIVVFNWPADTLYNMYKDTDIRYDKPIDKKTNYVKRCVAIAGDSLQIKNGNIYINGKLSELPERAKPQFFYTLTTKNPVEQSFLTNFGITETAMLFTMESKMYDNTVVQKFLTDNKVNLTEISRSGTFVTVSLSNNFTQELFDKLNLKSATNSINVNLTLQKYNQLKQDPNVLTLKQYYNAPSNEVFPKNQNLNWSIDNYGPIYIPKAGVTVALTPKSLPFYKKIISEYEGSNKVNVIGNEVYINDKKALTYTFKQDYFWMMGDNRHNSLDARYFGYTPEDHIVGKPVFIWMSIEGINDGFKNWSIRWDRLFTTVSGEGQPQSYFKYFLILLALYFIGEYFWKKRK
ncbi:MAG: signal peptidase I, partial [Flavobacterium sp.]|nr:signal peptidase I [Flavobacterium sp.]